MIISALKGQPLPIYGNGSQIRDWLYVEDHARALLQVLTINKTPPVFELISFFWIELTFFFEGANQQ